MSSIHNLVEPLRNKEEVQRNRFHKHELSTYYMHDSAKGITPWPAVLEEVASFSSEFPVYGKNQGRAEQKETEML